MSAVNRETAKILSDKYKPVRDRCRALEEQANTAPEGTARHSGRLRKLTARMNSSGPMSKASLVRLTAPEFLAALRSAGWLLSIESLVPTRSIT